MNEVEVKALFTEGMELFKIGAPIPPTTDRIRYLGWRTACYSQEIIDSGLANALEAYVELKREIKQG